MVNNVPLITLIGELSPENEKLNNLLLSCALVEFEIVFICYIEKLKYFASKIT